MGGVVGRWMVADGDGGRQDPKYNTCEEHVLSADEFENFIYRRVSLAAHTPSVPSN